MVSKQDERQGVVIGKYADYKDLNKAFKKYLKGDVFFFCVGSDRSSGDSLAPMVGTMLLERGYTNLLGTIDEPVHAMNLEENIRLIPKGCTVLAIDACLGKHKNIGKYILENGNLKAGAGMGKDLIGVGDYCLKSVVNVDAADFDLNFQILQNTRLSTVMKMAKEIVKAIEITFPLHKELTLVHSK